MTINWIKIKDLVVPYVMARAKERTTYIGIAALLAAFGVTLTEDMIQSILSVVTVLTALGVIVVPEKPAE